LRTTVAPGLIFRKNDILEIAKEVDGLNCRWTLQQFISSKGTLDPKLNNIESPTKKFLENLKKEYQKKYSKLRIDIKAM